MDEDTLYTVDEQVADELRGTGTRPVLLHAVSGLLDAGRISEVTVAHLLRELPNQRLATFDVDRLLDYRARRPLMTFDVNTWSSLEVPELAVELLRDTEDVPFLLLRGPEPDVQWERYAAAVTELVGRFDVEQVVSLNGVPMGVPHTRQLSLTAHATRPELVEDYRTWFASVQVPASIADFTEYRLGEAGFDAVGLAVHVPHYLAQSAYPQATRYGLGQVERITGLELGLTALDPAVAAATAEIDSQIAQSPEVAALVSSLEEQYDAVASRLGQSSLLAREVELPTADELGAEFERYLAGHDPGSAG